MAEYIEKDAILLKCEEMWSNADETTQTGVDTINAIDMITDFIEAMPVADVQPIDTKEILKHLDSLMICIGNAYNTSHYLLESDMEFIEKQEKCIKKLLA